MATTITGKLNKDASQFQAGESTGFGIRLGVKYYDRETKADAWTNYEAVVFAKAPAQVQFYQQVLVKDSVVEVSGDKIKIRQYQGNSGLSLSVEILEAKLGAVFAAQASAPAQQPVQQQRPAPAQQPAHQAPPQGYQPHMGNSPMQQGMHNQAGPIVFDDDIPFAPIGLSCRRMLHCI